MFDGPGGDDRVEADQLVVDKSRMAHHQMRRPGRKQETVEIGPEIARRIAEDYGVKIVFVTANPSQIGTDVEALGYIRKPFSETAILAAAALASGAHPAAANDDFVLLSDEVNDG